jgi:hypothetical protein
MGELGDTGVEVGVEIGCFVPQRAEVLDDAQVLEGERWQHFVANANPFEAALVVRRVVDERELAFDRVGSNIGPAAIEQRPDDPVGPTGLDPAETTEPGAPEHPREHGLCLVVLGVPHRDTRRTSFEGDLLERSVAKLPRARLKGDPLALDLDANRVERRTQLAGQLAYSFDFQRRLGPEAMVDRCDTERDAQLAAKPVQHV